MISSIIRTVYKFVLYVKRCLNLDIKIDYYRISDIN